MKPEILQKHSRILICTVVVLIAVGTAGYYLLKVGPEKQRKERIQPLIEAGLNQDEAIGFDKSMTDQSFRWPWQKNEPYHGEEITLARMWAKKDVVAKLLINYYYATSSDYRSLIWLLGSSLRNVSYWDNAVHWSIHGDANSDGRSNYASVLGPHADILETFHPNPITIYALEENIPKPIIKKLKPLEADGRMADWEKWVVNQIKIDNISENLLNWIVDNFEPNPVTIYGLKNGMKREEINRIKILGKDQSLSQQEKYLIDHLNSLPQTYVEWAIKETEPTEREIFLMDSIENLPPSFIENVVKKKVTDYETVSYEEWMQIQFLLEFGKENLNKKSKLWINDADLDNDGFTNEFERKVSATSPYVHNDRFAVFVSTSYLPSRFETKFRKIENFISLEGPLNNPPEGSEAKLYTGSKKTKIFEFYGENATYQKFRKTAEELIDLSDENDLVFFGLAGHGEKNRFYFSDGSIKYERMDEDLSKIPAKTQILSLKACYSGSAKPHLKSRNRIVMTGTTENELDKGGMLSYLLFESMTKKKNDKDNNNYCSIYEAFERARKTLEKRFNKHPQISGKDLAQETYFLEIYLQNKLN